MPKLTIRENVRDAVIAYIKDNHPETAQFMDNLAWNGEQQRPTYWAQKLRLCQPRLASNH